MNKRIIIGIVLIVVIALGIIGGLALFSNDAEKENNINNNENLNENKGTSGENNQTTISGNKVLVVYYSAQNHTKQVAEKIAENLDADLFEIIPKEKYSSEDLDWTDSNSRVSKEHDDETLRDIALTTTKVNNWNEYDTILIGYPIWWGIAAWPVDNFVKSNDFGNKTVIPFCTSASSGLGDSGKLLEKISKGGKWLDGKRFSSNVNDKDIKTWTDSIK